MKPSKTISAYLIERLHFYGVRHVFGIPGDYVISLYDQMQKSGLMLPINTCDEQGAGFAADAYARIRGLGVACHTYGVGGIKALHTTASSYAERAPVVVISGAPGLKERSHGPILHHTVKTFDSQLKMFEEVTVASCVLDNPTTAFGEIDRVLSAAMRHKRPVYIEIPRDLYLVSGSSNHISSEFKRPSSNPDNLQKALAETVKLINQAKKPVILADVELQRYGLQDTLERLLEVTNIPFATTILGKGLLCELHPLFLGVYQGRLGGEEVQKYVESSDCLIMLGMMLTDINLGLFTAKIDAEQSIFVSSEKVSIFNHSYEQVQLYDFVEELAVASITRRHLGDLPRPTQPVLQVLADDIYLKSTNGKVIPIPVGESIVGRYPDNPIILEESGVSRYHACIKREDNLLWITDLGSANGTFINNCLLSANILYPLRKGDEVGFGRELTYITDGSIALPRAIKEDIKSSTQPTILQNPCSSVLDCIQEFRFEAVAKQKITTKRLFEAVNAFLNKHTVVSVDNGETLIAGAELLIHCKDGFYAPGYYTSVGFAVPVAMGIQMANPKNRPLVLVGDGAFQMTGVELSTMVRFNLNPIVIVLNNGGYGSERPLAEGPYNDVLRWNYHRFPEVLDSGKGFLVESEDQLKISLLAARKYTEGFIIIDVRLEKNDYSPAFEKFLELFAQGVK
jgi:TPP-dependent 2-oxoacid decarboxylase